jgi:hypothetical protein
MNGTLEFSKTIAESNLPFFDGTMLIWAGAFIVLSTIFSIMTWRSQAGFTQRSLMYWLVNAGLFCVGIYFFTKTFPRLPGGWVLAGLFIMLFAISGMTVATKSKGGGSDKKEEGKDKK